MQRGLGACLLFAFAAIPMQPAGAGSLPEIKVSATNRVPACATPGRMMDYLKSRNPEIDPRYDGIATEYMRIGETLGVRWDFAFYQMIIETGVAHLPHGNRSGDVKPAQNNFAGLGATGGGETRRELQGHRHRRARTSSSTCCSMPASRSTTRSPSAPARCRSGAC